MQLLFFLEMQFLMELVIWIIWKIWQTLIDKPFPSNGWLTKKILLICWPWFFRRIHQGINCLIKLDNFGRFVSILSIVLVLDHEILLKSSSTCLTWFFKFILILHIFQILQMVLLVIHYINFVLNLFFIFQKFPSYMVKIRMEPCFL